MLELAGVADDLGYDCLWFTEEPVRTAGATTFRTRRSPMVLAGAVAAATRRIRVGVSVLPLTLHHAVRLAADIATLDVLSGGRVNLGVGWPDDRCARAFAQDAMTGPMLGNRLDTMIGCWEGRPVTIDGVDHVVEPIPLQHPHPPVYAAAGNKGAVAWAAERRYGLILSGSQSPTSLRRYLELFGSQGGDVRNAPVERFCFVAESDAQARERAWPLVTKLAEQIRTLTEARAQHFTSDEDLEPDRFYHETVIVGSPETVAQRVAELRDGLGVGYINLRPSLRGICPLSLQRITVELFATEVIPCL